MLTKSLCIMLVFAMCLPGAYALYDTRIVAIFDEGVNAIELGQTESIEFIIKNTEDMPKITDIYVGSQDDQLRNWMWFDNIMFSSNRTIKKVRLDPHEERMITINVFGGKTGMYDVFVGPESTDIAKAYGSKQISIVEMSQEDIFSRSPGMSIAGQIISVFIALILLMKKGNGYKINNIS